MLTTRVRMMVRVIKYQQSKTYDINGEIGYGDALKYDTDKIALFPIKQDDREWKDNEYLQLYPSIEYFDGTTQYTNTKEVIPEAFYVKYRYNNNIIVPLWDWLKR